MPQTESVPQYWHIGWPNFMLLSSKVRVWGCSICCTFPTSSVTIHPSLPKGHNQITCAFCLPVIFLILWFREQCSNSRAHENYQKGLAKTQLVCSSPMTSDPGGPGGTQGFALLTTLQMLQMPLGLGTRLWESVAQTFSPQTIILQSLPSLSPFMVSSCLQDKVQTSWQDTRVFYALTLSCFSPDPLVRIPLTPQLFTAGCWPVCTLPTGPSPSVKGKKRMVGEREAIIYFPGLLASGISRCCHP